jgi:K+-transporting ATPase ATPase C chain
MKKFTSLLRVSVMLLIVVTLLFGGVYPALVYGVTQAAFRHKANGSLLTKGDKVIGSALLGQEFTKAKYFWGRPSATAPAYNAASSGASNLNPGNPQFIAGVKTRVDALQKESKNKIPVDLVTASGSGLDPHISLAAAQYQVARVARARGMPESELQTLIEEHTQHWLDQSYVNVLQLNLALDGK